MSCQSATGGNRSASESERVIQFQTICKTLVGQKTAQLEFRKSADILSVPLGDQIIRFMEIAFSSIDETTNPFKSLAYEVG
jgi:hypothetical protein